MTERAKGCIWCGGMGKRTNDHVLGQWHSDIFPMERPRKPAGGWRKPHRIVHLDLSVPGQVSYPYEFEGGAQVPIDRQVSVCVTCNTTWMSRLQSDASAVFHRLQSTEKTAVSPAEQDALRRWIVMVTVTNSVTMKQLFAPANVRRSFALTQEIPQGVTVDLGHLWPYITIDIQQTMQYLQVTKGAVGRQSRATNIPPRGLPPAQTRTTVAIGRVIICCSWSVSEYIGQPDPFPSGMSRLGEGAPVAWPVRPAKSIDDYLAVATSLQRSTAADHLGLPSALLLPEKARVPNSAFRNR